MNINGYIELETASPIFSLSLLSLRSIQPVHCNRFHEMSLIFPFPRLDCPLHRYILSPFQVLLPVDQSSSARLDPSASFTESSSSLPLFLPCNITLAFFSSMIFVYFSHRKCVAVEQFQSDARCFNRRRSSSRHPGLCYRDDSQVTLQIQSDPENKR